MTKPRHEWTPGGSRDGRRYIESNDFAHDVTLFVSGDFSDDDERRAYTEHLAHKLNSIAELERDGPTGDFGHTHSDGTPWPCTMRHALNCMEMAAAAEANYADDMKRERDAAIKRAEAAEQDAARLDWIDRMFFERHWSGTLGEPSYWTMAGPFRHALQRMRGKDLRAAIDAARAEGA